MKILVTGAKGFVGSNLCAQLKNIRDGKARWYEGVSVEKVYEYDMGGTAAELDEYCRRADFVFNLAGVNRPENPEDFMKGNFGFASDLLAALKHHGNTCPVMISSSIQATLAGRFGKSEYGRSKKAGEELMFRYAAETGTRVLVYRFPNLFGKWCRPDYNSAVATFCHHIARGLPVQVNDRSTELELLYIDDLVDEMIRALTGGEHRCEFDGVETVPQADGCYCTVPVTHRATLGEIVDLLESFRDSRATLAIPCVAEGGFPKKLYSTYLSYLPEERFSYPLTMHRDERGSFTELLRTAERGQVSVNISRPGVVKGQHWHHTKTEKFCVVSGEGLVRLRDMRRPDAPVVEKRVSGERLEVIDIPTGYTHDLVNTGQTDMVTLIWCNECFDPRHPETYFEPVERGNM